MLQPAFLAELGDTQPSTGKQRQATIHTGGATAKFSCSPGLYLHFLWEHIIRGKLACLACQEIPITSKPRAHQACGVECSCMVTCSQRDTWSPTTGSKIRLQALYIQVYLRDGALGCQKPFALGL